MTFKMLNCQAKYIEYYEKFFLINRVLQNLKCKNSVKIETRQWLFRKLKRHHSKEVFF